MTWDFIKAQYLISAVKSEQYPDGDLPEIAFLGRSNVGKSSLINSLCRNKRLAKTSSTPGKTRTINFFEIEAKNKSEEIPNKNFFIVDLPGYGYAKASKIDKKSWSEFIRKYIEKSPRLQVLYLLIDIRHDLMANDKDAYDWLKTMDIPVKFVFTKIDKISSNAIQNQRAKLSNALGILKDDVIAYSAVKNIGRQELIDSIINYI